jgi:hypothetical protein
MSAADADTQEHSLQKAWALWHKGGKPGGKGAAGAAATEGYDCGAKIISFKTAEDFWRTYNNITPPGKLHDKNEYYLFADGIAPKYEVEYIKDKKLRLAT